MKKIVAVLLMSCSFFAASAQRKQIVKTTKAPTPIAPYSQAVRSNGLVFLAGQIGLNPETKKLAEGGLEPETVQILENIKAVLQASGAGLEDVVNTTIYIKDMKHFSKVNEIYGKYFTSDFPARTTVGVAELPGGASIEIAVIAAVPPRKK
jgi:2-iminobutanoate/2-iminopropanoate deaminase